MLFNSAEFAVFLPIVFALYWGLQKQSLKAQNLLILFASYLFYGWWDWRFLSLIIFSSALDFSIGIALGKTKAPARKRGLLLLSICINLGFLIFLKYYNFFVDSFADAFLLFGHRLDPYRLSIILPVGISFYTFQTLSYSVDIYRGKLKPTSDPVSFFAFVSFFPQLVAGPIERASDLLPQFNKSRKFEYSKAVDGMCQILWGLFKKMVIADNCAFYVNQIFDNPGHYSASTLALGTVFFSFQIYGDFSGYSDIAIGTSRLFGFSLKQNFAFPYFSRDIAEFWRRWHISLSSWFRDYLYIPLGGSKGGRWMKVRNTFIIFIVSGFWHGANWTFILWGLLNAIYFLPLLLLNSNRKNLNTVAEGKLLSSLRDLFHILSTFSLVCLSWIFFRAESIGDSIIYLKQLFTLSLFTPPQIIGNPFSFVLVLILICLFVCVEWLQRDKQHGLEFDETSPQLMLRGRYVIYLSISLSLIMLSGQAQSFIYFQF